MNLFIVGHARHGKDTVAEYIRDAYGLTFESSSMFCAERICRPWMEKLGVTYDSLEHCFYDRVNHREEWYKAIMEFNKADLSRLSKEIFESYDMYVGIRSREEFLASRHFADLVIWVDGSERVPELDSTCKILKSDADIIIDTNGTRETTDRRVRALFDMIIKGDHS